MAALRDRCWHYIFALWFLSVFFFYLFSSPNIGRRRLELDVYHTSTHYVALVRISNACSKCDARCSLKIQDGKIAKNRHLDTIVRTLSGYVFATKACIDKRKKLVKQQYVFHMFPQYGELRPTNGWDRLAGLGHLSKFERGSRLDFGTAATSLNGSQRNFAWCLAISWAVILCIHFRDSCP